MKNMMIIPVVALSFWACNNGDTDTTATSKTTDTANMATTETVDHSTMNMDTARTGGKTMMTMMTGMMDNMKGMQSSNNPDNDFASMMKAHHLGAIEMAEMEVGKGTDPQMKGMARKMIDDQQKEVAEFNTFTAGHTAHGGGDAFFKESMSIMNSMKMDMDHSGSIDKQFAQMMIPHHQSAIDMAKAYIKSGAHEEKLKVMATGIISSQQKEIRELKDWLEKK